MRPVIFLALLSFLGLVAALYVDREDFDDDDFGFRRAHRTGAQLIFPINPYVSSVELLICETREEQKRSKLLIAELMTNEVAAARIESFNIEYFCDIEDDGECRCSDLLGPFVGLIDRGGSYLKALKHVKWSSRLAMHQPLLISLEEHFPNLKLDLESPSGGNPSTLRSSPLLHSLRVYLGLRKVDTAKTIPQLTHVQTQIMDSPNLVELSMEIASQGCVRYEIDPNFARLKGKRFPPLERLTLEAFPLTIENVDYWMENMDWSQMESLDFRAIREPTYFFNESMGLAGGLPRLKTLRMELSWFRETRDLQEFEFTFRRFLGVPRDAGLSEIALEGDYRPYLQTILDSHGTALKKLRLHIPERPYEPQREMLSEPELSDLGRRAPNLEEISIDINHPLNGSLPIGFLDTLLSETTFPSLKTIELFGILGISAESRASRWSRNLTDQRPLISKLTSRASIDRIQIHVGEDRRMGSGHPAGWVLWEQDNWELWVAEKDESGKMVVRGPGKWDADTPFQDDEDV